MQDEIPKNTEAPVVMAESPAESLVTRLTVGGPQGKRNLDEFLAGLDLLPYVTPKPSKYFTWPGRPTLTCQLRAGGWQTDELVIAEDGRLKFPDPGRHFDIHFELQVGQWTRRMALYLHYETNPYYSQEKLRARMDAGSLEQYYRRRNQFIQKLSRECLVPGFKLSNQVVQIGKAELDFGGKTTVEAARWLAPIIDEVACAVHAALYKLDARRRFEDAAMQVPPIQP